MAAPGSDRSKPLNAYAWTVDGRCTSGLEVTERTPAERFLRRHGHMILVWGGDVEGDGRLSDARLAERRG